MTDEREKLAAELRGGIPMRDGPLGRQPDRLGAVDLMQRAAAYIEAHPAPAPVEYDEAGLLEELAKAICMAEQDGEERGNVYLGDGEWGPCWKAYMPEAKAALNVFAGRLSQVTAQRDELARALNNLLAFAEAVTTGVHAIEIDEIEREQFLGPARAALSRIKGEQP